MGAVLDRLATLTNRIRGMTGVKQTARQFVLDAKRRQLLRGVDSTGAPFAPLAASTLRQQPGRDPTPLIPHGAGSRLITGLDCTVETSPGRADVVLRWPGLPFVRYLASGTRRMPRRDPGGMLEADKQELARRVKKELFKP